MNKKVASVILAALMCISVTSCSNEKKSKTTTTVIDQSSETENKAFYPEDADSKVDLYLCVKNVTDYVADSKNGFPEMDISIQPPDELNPFINIIIVTKEKPDDENKYAEISKKIIDLLNHEASVQDPRISEASENSHGGLFERYDVQIEASNFSEMISRWYIDQYITAGTHAPIEINSEKIDLNDFSDKEIKLN